jgi:hypothetical protein
MDARPVATREETRAHTGEGAHTKDRVAKVAGPIRMNGRRHIDLVREMDYEPLPSFAFPGDYDPATPLRDDRNSEPSFSKISPENSKILFYGSSLTVDEFLKWAHDLR